MRTIYPVTVNNSDLVVVDKQIALLSDTLVAGYNMLDNKDFSGRNNHFTWNGSHNSVGAILMDDADHVMRTPITESDAMTFIVCMNLDNSSIASSLFSNLDTSKTNYSGARAVKLNNNQSVLNTATGSTNVMNQVQFNMSGAWTVRTFRWQDSVTQVLTHGGATTSINNTTRVKSTNRFNINGIPPDVYSSSITNGFTGTLGFVLAYSEFSSNADAIKRMDIVASIMADRGIVVP